MADVFGGGARRYERDGVRREDAWDRDRWKSKTRGTENSGDPGKIPLN